MRGARAGCDADNGFAQAGMALVAAAIGDHGRVASTVHDLIANPRATYLDRTYGWLAIAVSAVGDADVALSPPGARSGN